MSLSLASLFLMTLPCPIPPSPPCFFLSCGVVFASLLHLQCHRRVRAFCHSSSPPSRHHRPTPSSGSVGVQPTPQRDVVGAEPVTDQASAPGVGGLTRSVSGLGGSGSRPHSGSLQLPRSDRTADSGPSRDVIHPPVDRNRQEVLEDGELLDGEESGQDEEELRDYAPPSSSTMTPEPEMIDYWKSSIPAFSTSTSFRPLSTAISRTKKWSSAAVPDFVPPKQEPFARAHFNTFKETSKAAYDNAIHLMLPPAPPLTPSPMPLPGSALCETSLTGRTPLLRSKRRRLPG